ncbi:NADH-quinone oxidoreductase subunit NuoK, partial [Acidimicrobiia bacterium]|nr:NADH-quinone oxidoreductase subunit NuoK [Acidimicrobiia bacterium]
MIEVSTDWYLTLAAVLFSIGFIGMMIRKNALIMFMCIELMLNSVNLTFIAASRHFGTIEGQISVFFVLVVAAAEVVVGLAIIVSIFKKQSSASVDLL